MTLKVLPTKKIIVTTLVSFWSVSSLFIPEVASARPTASQIDNWLKVGMSGLGISNAAYAAYNHFMRDGEVRRDITDKNQHVLLSYTCNCRDRKNVNRFWQHPNNGEITNIIYHQFSTKSQQQQVVLNLINQTCGNFKK